MCFFSDHYKLIHFLRVCVCVHDHTMLCSTHGYIYILYIYTNPKAYMNITYQICQLCDDSMNKIWHKFGWYIPFDIINPKIPYFINVNTIIYQNSVKKGK